MHDYERVHPNRNGSVVSTPVHEGGNLVYVKPLAPVYLTVGSMGAAQEESWIEPVPAWSAVRAADTDDSYGYIFVQTANSTHLHVTFRSISGAGNGTVAPIDDFWIQQNL